MSRRPALLAVDAGGSKVEAALLTSAGDVLAAARSLRSHRKTGAAADGEDPMLVAVAVAVAAAAARAGLGSTAPLAPLGFYCMAGADFLSGIRRLTAQLKRNGWTSDNVVRNDVDAVLRAGSEQGWGVAVVCGFGTNCSAVAPDGRRFRLPAIGHLSGDWGGGSDIGPTALWFAVRAQDGRGGPTMLSELVPAHFGFKRPYQVMEAIHFGRLEERRLHELSPLVFKAARRGDAVSQEIVDRQADEIVTMAAAAIRKLRLTRLEVEVVLGGGIFHTTDREFFRRIEQGLLEVAPGARMHVLGVPPVVGAALLGLEHLGAGTRALNKARRGLTADRIGTQAGGHAAARR